MTLLHFFVLTGLFENYLQVKFKDPSFEVVSQKINCLKEMFNHPQHYHHHISVSGIMFMRS